MKELFDDSDFEKHIRDRLYDFEHTPEDKLKKKVFARLSKINGFNYRRAGIIIAPITIVLLFFLFGPSILEPTKKATLPDTENKSLSNKPLTDEQPTNQRSNPPKINANGGMADNTARELQPDFKTEAEKNIHRPNNDLSKAGKVLISQNFTLPDKLSPLPFNHKKWINIPYFSVKEATSLSKTNNKYELIDKNKNTSWGMYTNVLTFWTFQKATPNKNDEWIVSKMENNGRLSSERLGFRFDAGAFLSLSKQLELYGGISTYFQQFNSEFTMRSSKADSFQLDESTGGLTPVFSEETIDINKKAWSVGTKLGVRYYLPQGNKNFWISPNIDYQLMLTDISQEQFNISPNQLYLNLEFGWNKYLSKNLYFDVSPSFTYSFIQKVPEQSLISLQPYSWGINLGLKYRLKP